jgi:hypothetical protein
VNIPADDYPGARPVLRAFTSSKTPRRIITDNPPQHEEWVPGFEPRAPAPIDVATLIERLPEALYIAETREPEGYGATDPEDLERVLTGPPCR